MDYDFARVGLLLMVHKEASGHPKLAKIANAAMAELEEIANPPVDEPAPAPKAKAVPAKPTPEVGTPRRL